MSATATPQPQAAGLAAVATFFRLTVAEYHEMIRTSILTTDDRVELLDGYLVNKMPQNTPHSSATEWTDEALRKVTPAGWRIRCQLPITLANSEPEPDLAVVRGHKAAFVSRHPCGSDFGLVVEVSESSLALDRREKGRLYAEAGIPVYWVVNVVDRQVEVYADPDAAAAPPAYTAHAVYGMADGVPLVLDGAAVATIPVAELIP